MILIFEFHAFAGNQLLNESFEKVAESKVKVKRMSSI